MKKRAPAGSNGLLLALGMAAALALVTAAHYLNRFFAVEHPRAITVAYGIEWALLALGGYLVLYRAARRSYERWSLLTPAALFALCSVWGLFLALPSLYGPWDWAWSWSSGVRVPAAAALAGRILITAGLAGLVASFVHLGVRRALGQAEGVLRVTGPYRLSRNPQFVAFSLAVLGFLLLRPSAYAAGWACLFALLAHWMIRAEEEHLRRLFGEQYGDYCALTARFILRRRTKG